VTDDVRLELLLERWLKLCDAGQTPRVTEVCGDCPELIPAFERRLRSMERLAGLLGAAGAAGEGLATGEASSTGDRRTSPSFDFLDPPDSAGAIGRLGPYRILEVLGQGGMGVVFKAEEPQPRRLVALKVMRPEYASPEARRRFLREGQALATVEHERVVPVFRVDEADGVPYLVMPLLKGESLEDRLRRDRLLPLPEVLRVGREMAEGLAALHAAGLVHRDVKPSNVWLREPDGRVLLLDFGLAREEKPGEALTDAGAVVGTASYMSPEQAEGLPVDGRTDLFSLGTVLYRMTAGELPFTGTSTLGVLKQVTSHAPPPPHQRNPVVPPALSELVMRLLAKERDARPATAAEIAQRLAALEAGPAAARPPRLPLVAAALLAGVVAVGALVAAALTWPRPEPAGPSASAPPPAPEPFRGWIDAQVWDDKDAERQGLRLHQNRALPLRPNDKLRITAGLNRPGYLYVVWLDSRGRATPVYPWQAPNPDQDFPDWGDWPDQEEPRKWLTLPDDPKGAGSLGDGPSGMETLLLMVRSEPWPRDRKMETLFAGLPEQPGLPDPQERAWFENGRLVLDELDRAPVKFGRPQAPNDPVVRTQALLAGLRPGECDYTRAVCFAYRGSKP
jgi:hypothetical protein